MHELILRDAEGHDLGRKPMQPHERYALYKICMDRECLEHEGKRYRAVSGGWRIPEEDFICCVTFAGYVPVEYGDC